jgi:hypothetical protein
MCLRDGTEAIEDDELLYRRIPEIWHNPDVSEAPSPRAFKPTEHDLTGLSLDRAKYKSLEDAAKGQAGKRYYVAILRAGDLRARGIDVVPKPHPDNPGHCEIPNLLYETRKQTESQEKQVRLAHDLCLRIEGPFG